MTKIPPLARSSVADKPPKGSGVRSALRLLRYFSSGTFFMYRAATLVEQPTLRLIQSRGEHSQHFHRLNGGCSDGTAFDSQCEYHLRTCFDSCPPFSCYQLESGQLQSASCERQKPYPAEDILPGR